MWRDSDPIVLSVLQRSRSSFKHELLVDNVAGIPILQQHGSNDDNVPVYHSRLMHELLGKTQWPSQYWEMAGMGHWFEGIMTTPSLLGFYEETVMSPYRSKTPLVFTMRIPSSGAMGSMYGIHVDQLESPDMNGQIKVTRDPENRLWYLQMQNIHRFHLVASPRIEMPVTLVLDDIKDPLILKPGQYGETWYLKDALGKWMTSNEAAWKNIYQRYGRQIGAMDAILRSHGTFTVFTCSVGIKHIALQISRNLFQYFSADSLVNENCGPEGILSSEESRNDSGNAIVLAIGDDLPPSRNPTFPIHASRGALVLSTACAHHLFGSGTEHGFQERRQYASEYTYEAGMGALFLRPLENERLELIVWGADIFGLEQAARLVPTLTGAGQSEFLVLSQNCCWKGHSGLYAAGHFNKFWQISLGSYISKEPAVYENGWQ